MSSIAPRPCAFIRSRARSSRYLRSRSQLTRCCQSTPTVPKLAIPLLLCGDSPDALVPAAAPASRPESTAATVRRAASLCLELEGVVGVRVEVHARDPGRLHVAAHQVEAVADDAAGQPVAGDRHPGQRRPG